MTRSRSSTALAAVVAMCAALAAGCGGGGGGGTSSAPFVPAASSVPLPASGGSTQAVLQLALGAAPATQAERRARSVSPNTRGIGIVVTPAGGAALPAVYFSLNSATTCTTPAADGSRVCSFPLTVPIGTSTALITTYSSGVPNIASPPTTGSVLGTATLPITATTGAVTTVPVTLNPIVSRVVVTFANRPQLFVAGTASVFVTAFDGSGAAIIGPDAYVNPITLANSDTSGVTTLSTTAVTSPATVVTLAYNGTIPAAPAMVSATFQPVPGITPTPVPTATPSPFFTSTPAAFVPLGPRPGNGTFVNSVLLYGANATTVNPLPSIAAYPNTTFQPSPAPAPSPNQVTTSFNSPNPAITPTVFGTPIAASLVQFDTFGPTLTNQTANSVVTYLNYVVSGNRVNLVKTGQTTNTQQAFSNGTRVVNTGTLWPNGVILAKSPLTAGDTWTNSLKRTVNIQIFDNRPSAFYTSTISTLNYADDGSYTYVSSSNINPASGGGQQTSNWTIRSDGSWTETDVYPGAAGGYTEVDNVPAPVTSSSIQTATLTQLPPASPAPTVYQLPYPVWFTTPLATDTYRVDGPGTLDASCGLPATAANAGAYIVTNTQTRMDPQSATGTSQTLRDYTIPGAGVVCALVSTRIETHYVYTAVKTATDPSTGKPTVTTFEAFVTVPPVSVSTVTTQRLQTAPYALAPQSAMRNATSATRSGAPPPDPDLALVERFQERLEQQFAAHLLSSAFRGVR